MKIKKRKKEKKYDCIIVGAGPTGCVLAERLSNILNLKVLLIDKRNHIAGNCFDYFNKSGVLVHKYGPHYFRTNKLKILNYLKKFSEFINGNYVVKAYVNKALFDFPINLNTLEQFFNKKFNRNSARKFLQKIKTRIKKPKNFEDYLTNQVGKELFNNFYKNYTIKQWNKSPRQLSVDIAKRIPIRLNRNNKYVNHKYQLMPKKGFTQMFGKMIDNKKIKVLLNTDFSKIKDKIKYSNFLIYTGPIDNFFKNKYGKLEWRSLIFKFKNYKKEYNQKNVQINFPNNYKFTRKVEIKHVTGQKINKTTISTEYPSSEGDPYYPIMTKSNKKLYEKYKKLSKNLESKNIFFAGRLAQYTYINTDEAIERALKLFLKIKKKYENCISNSSI